MQDGSTRPRYIVNSKLASPDHIKRLRDSCNRLYAGPININHVWTIGFRLRRPGPLWATKDASIFIRHKCTIGLVRRYRKLRIVTHLSNIGVVLKNLSQFVARRNARIILDTGCVYIIYSQVRPVTHDPIYPLTSSVTFA